MATLAELRAIVGDAHAREGGEGDTIDGVRARWVAEPATAEEVAALLRLAGGAGWSVAPRGSGTKLGWGASPASVDLVLDTGRLSRVIEHASGDLVATVEAGVPLDVLQMHLAQADQMLALDPPSPAGTIGGIVAANASGPRRLRYGTVRDLLIGITVVLSDGTIAKAGGKVVKNVAGYDLAKLFTGSLGTLGVITQTTFRLHPRPAARRLVEVAVSDPGGAGDAVLRLLDSPLVPSAIQLEWPDAGERGVAILLEGIEPGVVAQTASATSILGSVGTTRVLADEQVAERWDALATMPWEPGWLGVKVTYLPAELPSLLRAIVEIAAQQGARPRVRANAGSGVLYLGCPIDDPAAPKGIIQKLRDRLREGSVVVQQLPPELKAGVDVWGPIGNGLGLMRRVKREFDPGQVLNPGRFVGGI